MTTLAHRGSHHRGRSLVLLTYGSLIAQVLEYAVVSATHLSRAVNTFQFVAIAGEAIGWIGLVRAGSMGPRCGVHPPRPARRARACRA